MQLLKQQQHNVAGRRATLAYGLEDNSGDYGRFGFGRKMADAVELVHLKRSELWFKDTKAFQADTAFRSLCC
jgi:hypothetical protein